jgi:PAS domain-containing protein
MPGKVNTTLAGEKERLAITLSSIGDGVIATDNSGRIVMFNAAAAQLTGWTQADAMGKPLVQVFHIIHHPTRTAAEDPARRALEDGVPTVTSVLSPAVSLRSATRQGARPASFSCSAIFPDCGKSKRR